MTTTTAEFRGSKYDSNLRNVEIAKRVRADVKAAIAGGELPAGIKVGVTCHGNSITAAIKAFPGPVLNPARVYADATGYWEQRTRLLYTGQVRRAMKTLEQLLCAYLRDSSDISTDYFNCNFYDRVEVACDTNEEREAMLASDELADLRVSKEADFGRFEDQINAYDSSERNEVTL